MYTVLKATIPLQDAEKHLCGPSILQRPLDTPLTPAMEAIGSHILKSKLRQSSLMELPCPSKLEDSLLAKSRTDYNIYDWQILTVASLLSFVCINKTGRHCCLWCTVTKEQMRVPLDQRGQYPLRCLDTIREDLKKFQDNGARPSTAKEFRNVIDEPLFDIPLNQDAVEVFTRARKKDEEADSLADGAKLMLEHLVSVQVPEQAAIYHQTIQDYLRKRQTSSGSKEHERYKPSTRKRATCETAGQNPTNVPCKSTSLSREKLVGNHVSVILLKFYTC
ncbi:hypothetical protein HOLleu_42856 [Holothuria leucospilota]|uniref:Uncharacterized protein n=1 Tax=Holothuria leucospilota TaxID=206669 RepID=A0A9Q0YA51_HOLLE|nr:hypothetical protein HOLleu_42856 [Holothuria leucospilota]